MTHADQNKHRHAFPSVLKASWDKRSTFLSLMEGVYGYSYLCGISKYTIDYKLKMNVKETEYS